MQRIAMDIRLHAVRGPATALATMFVWEWIKSTPAYQYKNSDCWRFRATEGNQSGKEADWRCDACIMHRPVLCKLKEELKIIYLQDTDVMEAKTFIRLWAV